MNANGKHSSFMASITAVIRFIVLGPEVFLTSKSCVEKHSSLSYQVVADYILKSFITFDLG